MKLIIFIIALIQSIQAYCVYNQMTDGSSIDVTQLIQVRAGSAFKKWIPAGGKECCHYSNRDCSPLGIDYQDAEFSISFRLPRLTTFNYHAFCYTGGALALHGAANNYWAECTDKEGYTKRVALMPAGDW